MIDYLLLFLFISYLVIFVVVILSLTLPADKTIKTDPIIISSHLKNKTNKESKIPKIIWAYWDSENLPEFVGKCIESLKYHNKDHQFILLNNKNLDKYIPDVNLNNLPHVKSSAALSDFIRLHVLRIHGGIWCDASIICNKPFSEWVHKLSPEHEFIGFTDRKADVMTNTDDYSVSMIETARKEIIIESWFLAAENGSEFIRLWCEEFMRMNNFNDRKTYIVDLKRQGVYMDTLINKTYLTVYASAMKVLQIDKYPLHKLKLYESKYTGFYIMNKSLSKNVLPRERVKFMLDNKEIFKQLEIIKLCNQYRNYIIKNNIDMDYFFTKI